MISNKFYGIKRVSIKLRRKLMLKNNGTKSLSTEKRERKVYPQKIRERKLMLKIMGRKIDPQKIRRQLEKLVLSDSQTVSL